MTSFSSRRRLVRRLIDSGSIESQHELVEMLEEAGHVVTQATVSRDLDAIGAVKVRTDDGGHRYEIQEEVPSVVNGDRETVRIVDEFVETMVGTGNLLVVRTRPGAAHVVASAVDRANIAGVMGTVAGDDTLLVVVAESTTPQGVIETLNRMGVQR